MPTLFDSEAGLVAIADELKKLASSIYAMKLLAALIARPLTRQDLFEIPMWHATRTKWLLELLKSGIVTMRRLAIMRRNRKTGRWQTRGHTKCYYLTDPYMAAAFQEAADFVSRRLKAQADEAVAFSADLEALRPISWAKAPKPRYRERKA